MEDEKILSLYFERSEDAIKATEERYGKYCYSIAYSVLSSHEDAEECVNDTYIRAWNAIPPQKPHKLSAFLGKITRNLALDRLSAAKTAKRGSEVSLLLDELAEAIPSVGGVEEALENKDLGEALNRFVKGLPMKSRKIFLGRYWYCRSVKELARIYSLSESNVKTLLHRTRLSLKKYLEKEDITI